MVSHFNVWRSFNNKLYKQTLTQEDIIKSGNAIYIESVFEVVRQEDKRYEVKEGKLINTKCIFLEKNSHKYILPTKYKKYLPINVRESFECYLKTSDKTIHTFITEPTSVKITPEKTLSLKELCQVFNPLKHTNSKTWTFLKLQSIGSKAKGGKYRLCSVPATGKSCNDTIIHSITNDNKRVSKPTLPKLETLFYYNQKVIIDEMTSLSTAQIKEVEPFTLSIADESPVFEKHSMALKKDMNEVDITKSTAVFTYNDRNSLQNDAKFFDDIWQNIDAMNSRYPAFYLEGEVVSELSKLSMKQANVIMEANFEKLKVIAKNLVYYFQNMHKELHNWDRSELQLRGRHRTNTECIIDAMDVWSETDEEFQEWITFVNTSIQMYKDKNKRGDDWTDQFVNEEAV